MSMERLLAWAVNDKGANPTLAELIEYVEREATSLHGNPADKKIMRAVLAALKGPTVVDVVAAVRRSPSGSVWLCKRNSDGDNAGLRGMWEYPGGKVERDEQLRDAMVRELQEEFPGSKPRIGEVLDCIESPYGDKVYRVTFFEVHMKNPETHPTHEECRWMTVDEACSVDHLPSGTIFNARHLARVVTTRTPDALCHASHWSINLDIDGLTVRPYDPDSMNDQGPPWPVWIGSPPTDVDFRLTTPEDGVSRDPEPGVLHPPCEMAPHCRRRARSDDVYCHAHGARETTVHGLTAQEASDGLESAWGIIANAYGGDWDTAPPEWRKAAERWRDKVWHPSLKDAGDE